MTVSSTDDPGRAPGTADDLFEHRLRRDLRRLAEGLVAGPGARADGSTARSSRWSPGGGGRIGARAALSPRAGWLVLTTWVVVALCLVTAGVVAGRTFDRPTDVGPLARATAALAGSAGSVAYVSGTGLYSGQPGTAPRRIATVGTPGSVPEWSPDGAWIAYLGSNDMLHVVRASGGNDHVLWPEPVTAMTWSPTADLLAVVPDAGADAGDLLLVPVPPVIAGTPNVANTAPTVLAQGVVSFVWSATGTRIAYVVGGPAGGGDRIHVVDVVTGVSETLPFVGPQDSGLLLGGWWPDGDGLVLWEDPGRSLAAEATGLELDSLPLDATSVMPLARTFVYLPWLAWSPGGHQLALVAMGGSFPWQASQIEVCDPAAGSCHVLAQPARTVSLDPAWSPNGGRLAFVRAPALSSSSPGPVALADWYQSRRLWVASADGGHAHEVRGAPAGAAEPRFGPRGSTLTVVTGSAIIEVPVSGGHATVVASGLVGAFDTAGPDGFGKVPWGGGVAWGA